MLILNITQQSSFFRSNTMKLVSLLGIISRALWTLFIVSVGIPAHVIWLYLMRPLLVICPALFWWMEGHITRYLHACMATMVMFAGYSGALINYVVTFNMLSILVCSMKHKMKHNVSMIMYNESILMLWIQKKTLSSY